MGLRGIFRVYIAGSKSGIRVRSHFCAGFRVCRSAIRFCRCKNVTIILRGSLGCPQAIERPDSAVGPGWGTVGAVPALARRFTTRTAPSEPSFGSSALIWWWKPLVGGRHGPGGPACLRADHRWLYSVRLLCFVDWVIKKRVWRGPAPREMAPRKTIDCAVAPRVIRCSFAVCKQSQKSDVTLVASSPFLTDSSTQLHCVGRTGLASSWLALLLILLPFC
jgi:hypothetical protein